MSSDDSAAIDVGSWFTTLARDWWVIVGLIAIGLVAGVVVTLAQPKQYRRRRPSTSVRPPMRTAVPWQA